VAQHIQQAAVRPDPLFRILFSMPDPFSHCGNAVNEEQSRPALGSGDTALRSFFGGNRNTILKSSKSLSETVRRFASIQPVETAICFKSPPFSTTCAGPMSMLFPSLLPSTDSGSTADTLFVGAGISVIP
jgi:hypothetical protein